MDRDLTLEISGRAAADIAASVRALIERGALRPGQALPPVRTLADGAMVKVEQAPRATTTPAK